MKEELLLRIFGDYTLVDLISYSWFILVGYGLYALIETTGRDVKSKNTPKKWSWNFWLRDNWRRYIVTILCTYALFRFYTEFNGTVFTDFDAFTIGVLGDGIAAVAKKRIKGLSNRNDYKDKENEQVIHS